MAFQPRTAAMETLDSVPLKFKVTMCCTRLSSLPDGVQSVSPPPRSAGPTCAQGRLLSPCASTVPSVASSASDSESVNAFVTGSVASAAASSLSLAPLKSIPVYLHRRLATCAPGRMFAFSHRSRIGRVVINCATVFCLQRIEVQI